MNEQIKQENTNDSSDGQQIMGFVASTSGATVVVVSADGTLRELNPGDAIHEGDILQVTDGSHVTITFADGSTRYLDSGDTFAVAQNSFQQLALADGGDEQNPEFEALLAALNEGQDITEGQEATAAGEAGAAGGSGDEIGQGLYFNLIGGEITPTAGIDPDYQPPGLPDPTADTDLALFSPDQGGDSDSPAGDLSPTVEVTIDSFDVANNGDVTASGTLTATGGNGPLATTLVVKIDGEEYNATVTGTGWSLDAGQSVTYEEGKSYGITAEAETTDADGDKASDSASAGDLSPTVEVTIDSFDVANNGDVTASGTLTATGGNGPLATTLVVKIDGEEYNATVTGTGWSLDAGQSVTYEEGKSYGITAEAETTDADGDKASDSAWAGESSPSIEPSAASVSEEGLPGGMPDSDGVPADTSNLNTATGTISVADLDGDALTVTLAEPLVSLISGGDVVTWSGGGTNTLVGSAASSEVIRIVIDDTGKYTVTLSAPLEHPVAGVEDVITFDVDVSVTDGMSSATAPLTISIEDDAPVGADSTAHLYIGVDQVGMMGLQMGFKDPVFQNGTNQVAEGNTDSDSYIDYLGWGRPVSSDGQSAYVLTDNPAYSSVTPGAVMIGESFKLADFQHLNFPISTTSSILDSVVLTVDMQFVINGEVISLPVNIDLNIDHNETPNSGSDPRDIITLPSQPMNVQLAGQDYEFRIDGFLDSFGNVVTSIYTEENTSNSFAIMGSLHSIGDLPTVSGNVLLTAGADGSSSNVLWGDTDSLYGTMLVNPDGSYTYELSRDAKEGLEPGQQITENFTYTVTDEDGDSVTNTLTINIGGYQNVSGTDASDVLNGDATDDYLMGGELHDTLSGGDGNDILAGGSGDDSMTGGAGADIFLWNLGDEDANGLDPGIQPSTDTISDFDISEGDVLDLSSLLGNVAESGATLDDYLSISFDGDDTVVKVDVSGGTDFASPDQTIILQGVDITGGETTQSTLIDNLVASGTINTNGL